MLAGATVVDAPGPHELLVERDGLPVRVAFERLVLATGARELFLPFPGWTLPGVVGVGGAQALLKAGARFEGLRVVVAGSGPLLLAVAAGLKQAGARIVGIAEQAPFSRLAAFGAGLWRQPRRIAEGLGYAATLRGVPWRAGTWVREALGDEGVHRVVLAGARAGEEWECDVLACGFGLVPNLELPRLLGCETTADGVVVDASQRTSRDGVFATGELCGIAGVEHALATGAIAGLAAAGRATPRSLAARRARETRFAGGWPARSPCGTSCGLSLAPTRPSAAARTSRSAASPRPARRARPSCSPAPAWAPARVGCAARRSASSAASRPTACAPARARSLRGAGGAGRPYGTTRTCGRFAAVAASFELNVT